MDIQLNSLGDILRSSGVIRASFEVGIELGRKVYLVGGTVRDLLLHSRLGNDFDFAVEGNGTVFARAFADKTGGSFFVLDEERDNSRVVSNKGSQADFSGLGCGIEKDLMRRDFTVNSMAIPLDELLVAGGQLSEVPLIDPTGGRRDIENMVLKATFPGALKEDPLRILRAFRFSTAFSLRMEDELQRQIIEDCRMLGLVSPERIRTEFFMTLEMPGAGKVLKEMDEAGVLKVLLPEVEKWKGFFQGGWHAYDLFDHSMKTVDTAEEVLKDLNRYFPGFGREIDGLMTEEVEAYVTRRGLLKLASLLHDSGKFYTRTMEGGRGRFLGHERAGEGTVSAIAKGLKLSRRSEAILRGLTLNHMRVLALSKLKKVTNRARYRFFKDTEGFGTDLLILSLADAMATPIKGKGFEEVRGLALEMIDYYFKEFTKRPPRPLLTGDDIMTIFGVPQGKEVGVMLDSLSEAEAVGKVSNKREAIIYLKRLKAE